MIQIINTFTSKSKSVNLSNIAFNKIAIVFNLLKTVTGMPVVPDYSLLTLNVKTIRNGQTINNFASPLNLLINFLANKTNLVKAFYPTQTAGNSGIFCVTLPLPFPISARGNDSVIVELITNNSAYDTSTDTTSQIDVLVENLPSFTSQKTIVVNQEYITANSSNYSKSGLNQLLKASFVNTDQTTLAFADMVVSSLQLNSSSYSHNLQQQDIIGLAFTDFSIPQQNTSTVDDATSMINPQTIDIYNGSPLDGVNINLSLNAALVNANNNAVMTAFLN